MSRLPLMSTVSPTLTLTTGSFDETKTSRPAFSVAVLSWIQKSTTAASVADFDLTAVTTTSLTFAATPVGTARARISGMVKLFAGHAWLPGFASSGQASQTSPFLSPSLSLWSVFGSFGQLSIRSGTVSPSTSPETSGQSSLLALSGQTSQKSPTPSLSLSAWAPPSSGRIAEKTVGQRSVALGMPSPSESSAVATPVNSPGREGTQLGSLVGTSQNKKSYSGGCLVPLATAAAILASSEARSSAIVLPVSRFTQTRVFDPQTSTSSQPASSLESCLTTSVSPARTLPPRSTSATSPMSAWMATSKASVLPLPFQMVRSAK
jgi:hypothetical protein